MSLLYGIDTEKLFTPCDLRNAIVTCFLKAHEVFAEQSLKGVGNVEMRMTNPKAKKDILAIHSKGLVMRAFKETGGNFSDPTYEDICNALEWLKEYAKKFRDSEIIAKNYGDIKKLIAVFEKRYKGDVLVADNIALQNKSVSQVRTISQDLST